MWQSPFSVGFGDQKTLFLILYEIKAQFKYQMQTLSQLISLVCCFHIPHHKI